MHLALRTRLSVAFAAGMATVLSALGAFLYLRMGAEILASVDSGLRSRAELIAAGIEQQDVAFGDAPGSLIDPDEAFAQILDGVGRIVEASSAVSEAPLVTPGTLRRATRPIFVSGGGAGLEEPARLLVVPVGTGDARLFVVVGATLSDRAEALHRLLLLLAIGGPAALALTAWAGWVLAGAALRPVERLRTQAAAISVSEPGRRLAVPPTQDELARLATTLNEMLDRLQGALERERRFVDDASHELRSPLAILSGELELALARPRSTQDLAAALRRAQAEVEHLTRVAEDLLVLSRARDGRLPVHRVGVSLGPALDEWCAPFRERARAAGVTLDVRAADRGVWLDPTRLRQAIGNLLDNALRHTPPGGTVRVEAAESDGAIRVSVEDDGPGFPVDLLPRAFEPFARSSEVAGGDPRVGLGLAIVRAVAEAHGGTVVAENRPEGGARVTLALRT